MDIAISSWSLRDHVGREFPITDFGKTVKDRFGVTKVELCQMHFVTYDFGFAFPAQETAFLDDIRDKAERASIDIVNVPVDVGNVSQVNEEARAIDIEVVKTWIAAAKRCGSQAVRVNTESVIAREKPVKPPVSLSATKQSFAELCRFAEDLNIQLLLENHGGISANPEKILEILDEVSSNNFGICADLGNFDDGIRVSGLKKLAPHTRLLHAKTYDFNSKGEIDEFDFGKCLSIFKDAGYDGSISIEFEGSGDQWEGVEKTIALVKRYWD